MSGCPNYEALPGFQLSASAGKTGPFDCTAWAARVAIATSTCGKQNPSGRTIRLQSSEPVPDPRSPGLNLPQVAAVALRYGVNLDVRIGTNAVTWAEYEKRRKAGQPTILQVGYAALAASRYDAGRGFRGNHALAETTHATYDSLADGRAPGVFRFDGSVYSRSVVQTAAARLDIGNGQHPKPGTVWAAFGPDVVPVPPTAWGSDVPASLRAVNPDGRKVLAKVKATGHKPGDIVNMDDLQKALDRIGHDWGTVVDPSDVRVLLAWAA